MTREVYTSILSNLNRIEGDLQALQPDYTSVILSLLEIVQEIAYEITE